MTPLGHCAGIAGGGELMEPDGHVRAPSRNSPVEVGEPSKGVLHCVLKHGALASKFN